IKYKQAEFLLDRIGHEFDGIVSGLTNWGIYVELIENKCEGMIGLREIPGDVFRFDQEKYTVIGQRTGRRISLGDELRVRVKAVDMDRRTVDFDLADEDGDVTTSGKFQRRKNPQLAGKASFKENTASKGRTTAKGKGKKQERRSTKKNGKGG